MSAHTRVCACVCVCVRVCACACVCVVCVYICSSSSDADIRGYCGQVTCLMGPVNYSRVNRFERAEQL